MESEMNKIFAKHTQPTPWFKVLTIVKLFEPVQKSTTSQNNFLLELVNSIPPLRSELTLQNVIPFRVGGQIPVR